MKNVFTFKNIQLAIVAGVFVFLAMYVVAPQVTQTFNTAEACCGSDGGSGGGGGGNSKKQLSTAAMKRLRASVRKEERKAVLATVEEQRGHIDSSWRWKRNP